MTDPNAAESSPVNSLPEELLKELQELRQEVARLRQQARAYSSGLLGTEEDYRRLVEFSPDAIAIHQQGRFVFVNQAGAALIGAKSGEELVGKSLLDVVHPDYREMVIKRASQTHQGMTTPLQEEKFIRLDGQVIDVEVVAIPIKFRDKPATQVVVVDITEKKRLTEELRANEERLRLASEAGGWGTWEWHVETDKITLSPNMQSLLGPRTDQFENNFEGFYRLVHPDDRAKVKQNMEQALHKGQPYDLEFRLNGHGPRPIWIAARARAFLNDQGQPQRLIGVVQNITRRKQAEENLRLLAEAGQLLAAELDFEATLQNLARLVVPLLADWCAVDLPGRDGHLQRVVLYHSDPERLDFARQLEARFPPHSGPGPGLAAVMKAAKAVLVPQISEESLLATAQNEEHGQLLLQLELCSSVIIPLVARGEALGVLSLSQGDSGRHYSAEDLTLLNEVGNRAALALDNARLYREAREAIKEREDFLSIAAHELKTPVTGIRGYAQMLLRQLARGQTIDPDRLSQSVQIIQDQASKLAELINQLLDLSRIEAGKLALDLRPVDLGQVVRSVVGTAQTTTTNHTLIIHQSVSPLIGLVDVLRIEQVLTNLLDNAIKYSPEGGPIEIELGYTAQEDLKTTPVGKRRIRLAVTDRGLGVPPEHQAHIFDRFYQGHTGSYYGGIGLGLNITRQIVEMHDGEIDAEFPGSGGSIFIVYLPDL